MLLAQHNVYEKSSSTHDHGRATLVGLKEKKKTPKREVPAPERSRTHQQPVPIALLQ